MSLGRSALVCLFLVWSVGGHGQTVDSSLGPRALQPVMDTLAIASPEAQAQPAGPGKIAAAVAIMIGAGLLVYLLYNVRSR